MLKLFLTVIKIFLVYVSVVRDSSQCMMVYVPSAAGTLSGLQTESSFCQLHTCSACFPLMKQ